MIMLVISEQNGKNAHKKIYSYRFENQQFSSKANLFSLRLGLLLKERCFLTSLVIYIIDKSTVSICLLRVKKRTFLLRMM